MGISGGMVRLKGNSPKVSKDPNRQRQIKQFGGSGNLAAGLGSIGGIGKISSSGPTGLQGVNGTYGIRNIQSSKGMNRPPNNLMMSQQVVGSSHLGNSANQGFANSQIINQQQLGIFKAGGPVRATAFNIDPFSGMGQIQSQTGQILAGRKAVGGSGKAYKRGQGSLGPSSSGSASGLRPGTAQKRPASPNTQGLLNKGVNGPSPYSFGLLQQHNNLMGGSGSLQAQMMVKQRTNGPKPSSAPSKNRIRSHSPMNIEGQAQQMNPRDQQSYA